MGDNCGNMVNSWGKALWLSGLVAAVIAVMVAGCAVPTPTPTLAPTPRPTATPTPEATLNLPATVQAGIQATMTARPTATPLPTPTITPAPTATPTPTPTLRPTATLTPTPTLVPTPTLTPFPPLKSDPDLLLWGPSSESIIHEPGDGFLEVSDGVQTSGDVVVEATFHNPYSTVSNYWQHGFLLRNIEFDHFHWVSIDSYGEWLYFYRLGDGDDRGFDFSFSSFINTTPGGKNRLRVVMIGTEGWVYINGKYVGSVSLSAITGGGYIRAFIDDDYEGETRVERFTVWKYDSFLARQLPDVGVVPTPTPTFSQALSNAATVSYDELFRNNERYVGDVVRYKGEVVDVTEIGRNRYWILVDVTQDEYYWKDPVFLHYSGPRLLGDDIIEFVGRIEGLHTYESVFGASVTLPEITVIQSHIVTKAADR